MLRKTVPLYKRLKGEEDTKEYFGETGRVTVESFPGWRPSVPPIIRR